MKIFIIHHHLRPGGVSRIIQSQIRSLQKTEMQIITGYSENSNNQLYNHIPIHIHPEFDYDSDINADNIYIKADKLIDICKMHISKNDILHIHNLNLGKNPALTLAIYKMMNEGYRIFHHCHDFAEDRPLNYQLLKTTIEDFAKLNLSDIMYPKTHNYKIGVLNQHDFKRLKPIVDSNNLFLLPNPVELGNKKIDKCKSRLTICNKLNINPKKKIVTYPVRVIQRKNIAELILLATIYSENIQFLVTLPPKNPVEIIHYEKWLHFCKQHNINILFEVGAKLDFETIIAGSDFCITTSIQEGFGMTYLEPWLLNTPVVGRAIPEIIADLKKAGIIFTALYDEIKIPNSNLKFSELPDNVQQDIIINVQNNIDFKQTLLLENKILSSLFNDVQDSIFKSNYNTIKQNFSLESYGQKLQRIYKTFFE